MSHTVDVIQGLLGGIGVLVEKNDDWKNLPVFFPNGKLKPMPAVFWHEIGYETRRLFLHFHAQYFLPTIESIGFLSDLISDVPKSDCLEIGAGNGWLGFLLGIKMTDSHLQNDPKIRACYELANQPVIKYGLDVEKLDGLSAVKKYKPHTVVASWVSEYRPGGSPHGVKEDEMMDYCKRYVFVGSDTHHSYKSLINKRGFKKYRFPGLLSRAKFQEDNAIWVFEK